MCSILALESAFTSWSAANEFSILSAAPPVGTAAVRRNWFTKLNMCVDDMVGESIISTRGAFKTHRPLCTTIVTQLERWMMGRFLPAGAKPYGNNLGWSNFYFVCFFRNDRLSKQIFNTHFYNTKSITSPICRQPVYIENSFTTILTDFFKLLQKFGS